MAAKRSGQGVGMVWQAMATPNSEYLFYLETTTALVVAPLPARGST